MNDEFRSLIQEQLPLIDDLLEERRLPIHERTLRAAIMFVDICIIEVSTGTKEEFIHSEHFASIVNVVVDWYMDKYGQLVKSKKEMLSGIVRYYNQPVLLNIPATTSKVETEGETAWITFPDHLQQDETHKSMFVSDLKFDNLPEDDLHVLNKEVEEVVALSRRTRISLMTSSVLNTEAPNMAGSIWAHIEKAISDIISGVPANISLACWELHLAVEKSLKVYISQFPGEKGWGHDLITLCQHAKKLGLVLDEASLAALHGEKYAIKARYCEIDVDQREIVEEYMKVLKLVCTIASQLKRKYSIYNASFLLKMAPWAR